MSADRLMFQIRSSRPSACFWAIRLPPPYHLFNLDISLYIKTMIKTNSDLDIKWIKCTLYIHFCLSVTLFLLHGFIYSAGLLTVSEAWSYKESSTVPDPLYNTAAMNEINIIREGWLHKRGKEREARSDITMLIFQWQNGLLGSMIASRRLPT